MLQLRNHENHSESLHPHHRITHLFKTDAILVSIGLILIGTSIVVAYICYRKYRTRRLYNESPQVFSRKPNHGLKQIVNLSQCEFKALTADHVHQQNIRSKQLYEGKVYEVTFYDGEGAIYFNNKLKGNSYFEIELLQQNSLIEIGFVHADDLDKVRKGNNADRLGVFMCNYGTVLNAGQRVYAYGLSMRYGDTIGVGITDENGQKRAWFSHNGNLLNPPTPDEIDVWIANENFDEDDKQEYENKADKAGKAENADDENGKQKQSPTERENAQQRDLIKRKVNLNTSKSFQYYAMILSSEGKAGKNTIINANVGGQIFRMSEKTLSCGLLG